MHNGQLIFVILFILAITLFSFFREKKKKPKVLILNFPFDNKVPFLQQLKVIAGYQWDFVFEKNDQLENTETHFPFHSIMQKIKPKFVFYFIDFANPEEPAFRDFRIYCAQFALSLLEKHSNLVVVTEVSRHAHHFVFFDIIHEFALPILNLDEVLDLGENISLHGVLAKDELNKLAGKVVYHLDKQG